MLFTEVLQDCFLQLEKVQIMMQEIDLENNYQINLKINKE